MPSEKDCFSRLSAILLTLSFEHSADIKALEENKTIKGLFIGLQILKPDSEPKDSLKEVWQIHYEQCKEHLIPRPQSKSNHIQ